MANSAPITLDQLFRYWRDMPHQRASIAELEADVADTRDPRPLARPRQHDLRDVHRMDVAPWTDAARELERRVAASRADVEDALARANARWRERITPHRLLMIATPNRGAEIVGWLEQVPGVALAAGPAFHLALANKVFKDNRIPPRGFSNAAFAAPFTALRRRRPSPRC